MTKKYHVYKHSIITPEIESLLENWALFPVGEEVVRHSRDGLIYVRNERLFSQQPLCPDQIEICDLEGNLGITLSNENVTTIMPQQLPVVEAFEYDWDGSGKSEGIGRVYRRSLSIKESECFFEALRR